MKTPSQRQLSILLEHYQKGRFSIAEKLARSITQEYPNHQLGWKVLGVVLMHKGKKVEALDANQKAVALSPRDAEAFNNLGNTQKELGRLKEAEGSYKKVIALKPVFAGGYYNLGVTLKQMGRIKEAAESYRNAIALKPDFFQAHNNLGNALKEQGKLNEACTAYFHAIALNPNANEVYFNMSQSIKDVRFNAENPQAYQIMVKVLTIENLIRPKNIARSILSLLEQDPVVKGLLQTKNNFPNLPQTLSAIENLNKLNLLHDLMRLCPLPDLRFERLFVSLRSVLLKNLEKIETSPELIHFLSTLSLHCFTNEYVYGEKEEETDLVNRLEDEIAQAISKSEQPTAIKILCFSTYRPLHRYNWCIKLKTLDLLEEVERRLIKEPLAEKAIAREMATLGKISNDVSNKVSKQYEENPYPRWVKLGIPENAMSISEFCDKVRLRLYTDDIRNVAAPAILIAGCGTGQHSIETASRFSGCKVTAVDLSRTSLAYAKRKTVELAINNIKYFHADILNLKGLKHQYDVIESAGVLHHMNEPMAGWKTLTDLLKPGGLMKIGLYSEAARKHIVSIREEIAVLNLGTSESDIRSYRQFLFESHDAGHQQLTKSADFFSLSALRDLVFNVQEHRFTLPQIQSSLNELGLKFCGFEVEGILPRFKGFHGQEADVYDLALWHEYETKNPLTFLGMYQFWCQKI